MKLLKRNETEFSYQPLEEKTEILKDSTYHTGQFELTYGEPETYMGNISVPYGQSMQTLFGLDIHYTHVLLMDDVNADIREDGLIHWKGNVYEIKAVRPSLNVLAIALRKVTT